MAKTETRDRRPGERAARKACDRRSTLAGAPAAGLRFVPRPAVAKGVVLLALAAALSGVLGGLGLTDRVVAAFDLPELARGGPGPAVLAAVLLAYVLLLACPFVPGAEIGLALLVLLGPEIAAPVYLATVAALCLSFGIGRLVPEGAAAALFHRLGLDEAGERVRALGKSSRSAGTGPRTGSLTLVERVIGWALRFRGLALAVLINTPGNSVLGGGGGIALATGLGRLMPFRQFVVSVALAVAPVPLAFGILGWVAG